METSNFKLIVVCIIKSNEEKGCLYKFDSIRYILRGNGFYSWWKQESLESIVTKCLDDYKIFKDMHESNEDFYFL